MQVGSVMRTTLVTASPEETAAQAIRRMLDAGIGSVVVCDEHRVVGIFTERDVLRLAGEGADFEVTKVAYAMTRDPITVGTGDGILDVATLMGDRKLRHLPVVEDGNLVGMVSTRDVLAFLAERLYAEHDEAAAETARSLLGRSVS